MGLSLRTAVANSFNSNSSDWARRKDIIERIADDDATLLDYEDYLLLSKLVVNSKLQLHISHHHNL